MDSPCIKQTVCKVLKIFQYGKYLVAYVLKQGKVLGSYNECPMHRSFFKLALKVQRFQCKCISRSGILSHGHSAYVEGTFIVRPLLCQAIHYTLTGVCVVGRLRSKLLISQSREQCGS